MTRTHVLVVIFYNGRNAVEVAGAFPGRVRWQRGLLVQRHVDGAFVRVRPPCWLGMDASGFIHLFQHEEEFELL